MGKPWRHLKRFNGQLIKTIFVGFWVRINVETEQERKKGQRLKSKTCLRGNVEKYNILLFPARLFEEKKNLRGNSS